MLLFAVFMATTNCSSPSACVRSEGNEVKPLSQSIPRATQPDRFRAEPLAFLTQARAELGDIFVLRDHGPILSREPDCSGVVAVFGSQRQRAVLGDIESFGMPQSAAKQLALTDRLSNLNRSLHSMRGKEHARQKRVLSSILDGAHDGIASALEEVAATWKMESTVAMLREMRELTMRLASRIVFGDDDECAPIACMMHDYFHLRREAASPMNAVDDAARAELVDVGNALDDALRRHVRALRRGGAASDGLLGKLAAPEAGLMEEEVLAHANILFVSGSEPVAVALTWTLLILSQLPELRRSLRGDLPLLDDVLSESLRLLPPNALMARITTHPVSLCDTELPARCEVILSPFVAHRDAERFPDPHAFHPSRWREARPSSFDYFPFGAGGHACVGRRLALDLMKSALAFLLARYDLILASDQKIDWRVHIQFMPSNEPMFLVRSPAAPAQAGGKLGGAVGAMFALDDHNP
jgi:cytochrome P450